MNAITQKCRSGAVSGLIIMVLALLLPPQAAALSARLLPEESWRLRFYQNVAEADSWYGANGERRPLGDIGLQKLAENGVPTTLPGAWNLQNKARYRQSRSDIILDYGITDDLTLGAWLPWFSHGTRQRTTLNQGPSFGLLPAPQQAAVNAAVASLDDTDPEQSGWGDLFLGVKQRIVGGNRARFRFSLGGGVRAPTGHVADPLDSEDLATGDGQWDLSLWSWTDYQFTENFFINLQTRHDYGLSGNRQVISPLDSSQTLRMEFQPAVHHQLRLEPQYRIPFASWDLLLGMTFIYDHQGRERRQRFNARQMVYSGSLAKVDGTGWERFMVKSSLGFRLRQFKLPVMLWLSYSRTVSGENTLDIDALELRLDLYFRGRGE